jgi:hypothetical protein
MHPDMMIALARVVESDRQRQRKQFKRRSLSLRQGRTGATNPATRIPGNEFVRRLLVVPRLLARLSLRPAVEE